jgi:tetratricopeptide (TPR) repeat protein
MANELLTEDDLEALASPEGSRQVVRGRIQTLVQAVDEDRIADPADVGYALSIAADLLHHIGDLATAIDLAERAVAADLVHLGTEHGRGLLAELLFAEGRETEAFQQLEPLRALMTVDALAGRAAAEALEASGRTELAVEWLTEALATAIEVGEAIPEEQEDARDHAAGVIYELVTVRHRMREDMGLDHDDYDRLADELREAVGEGFEPGPVLFWPEAEFAELLRRWPYQTETFTRSWDAHRTMVETELQAWSESGHTGLSVIPGTVADLVALIEREGVTVVDEDVQLDYLDELVESDVPDVVWPPPRNGPCWCGSGAKYKKCCLLRPRLAG